MLIEKAAFEVTPLLQPSEQEKQIKFENLELRSLTLA